MILRSLVLACLLVCGLGAVVHPELAGVKTVYLLPMASAMDQYIANQLTKEGRFEVVTDPAKADAIFTDRLGVAFEDKWKELYPPPEPPKPVQPAADDKDAKKKDKVPDLMDVTAPPRMRTSSFGRGRGNVFLVSRKTQSVIWSHFLAPSDSQSKTLDKKADRIVDQLHKDLKADLKLKK